MSNVWYSSEVAGTILVQCIPVLRPFLREVQRSLTSKRLPSDNSSAPTRSWAWTVSKMQDSSISEIPQSHLDLKALEGAGWTNGLNFGFNETKISSNTGLELGTIQTLDGEEKGGITRGRSFRTVTSQRSEHLF